MCIDVSSNSVLLVQYKNSAIYLITKKALWVEKAAVKGWPLAHRPLFIPSCGIDWKKCTIGSSSSEKLFLKLNFLTCSCFSCIFFFGTHYIYWYDYKSVVETKPQTNLEMQHTFFQIRQWNQINQINLISLQIVGFLW